MDSTHDAYFLLFNCITDTIEQLKKIQREAEDLYATGDGQKASIVNFPQMQMKKGIAEATH